MGNFAEMLAGLNGSSPRAVAWSGLVAAVRKMRANRLGAQYAMTIPYMGRCAGNEMVARHDAIRLLREYKRLAADERKETAK